MRCLVIYCHPVEDSFAAALHERALAALRSAGHEVRDLDLYAMGFDPVLSRQERVDYHTVGANEAPVADQIEHIRWAEALVFVYPTWWYGLPAMLKGWLDRVWVPHVTFTLPENNKPIRGLMTNIRHIVGITTYGSPWWWIKVVRDPGRRTLTTGIRAICHPHCRTAWLGLYRMDESTQASRDAFLERVERTLARL